MVEKNCFLILLDVSYEKLSNVVTNVVFIFMTLVVFSMVTYMNESMMLLFLIFISSYNYLGIFSKCKAYCSTLKICMFFIVCCFRCPNLRRL